MCLTALNLQIEYVKVNIPVAGPTTLRPKNIEKIGQCETTYCVWLWCVGFIQKSNTEI